MALVFLLFLVLMIKFCTSMAYIIFLLLIFITLIASFSWLETQHKFTPQDHYVTNKLKLKTVPNPSTKITCDRSHFRYDLCSINGPTVLDPTNATLHSIAPFGIEADLEKIKPYPRKLEIDIMAKIRTINLQSSSVGPKCEVHHNSPALVFSAGGLTGNFYHAFTDGFLPLYITLNNLSSADRDIVLVVDDARDWWLDKYADIINAFTKHPIINLGKENTSHCFTKAYVGLITHGIMALDPKELPQPLTLAHFRSFLGNIFHRHDEVGPPKPKPRLVWVARTGGVGRVVTNLEKAREVAEAVGFDVVIYNPTKHFPLRDAYRLMSGAHAMIGVHGAGMTHMLFLRKGAVAVQVLPLGLGWVGHRFFGWPARDLGLEYMEYKIGYNESSLSSKYEKENHILKDAKELLVEKGWALEFMNVYLIEQDVRLDLVKFKVYMGKVYRKAKRFMDMHG